MVQNECLSEVSAGDAEEIVNERGIRRVDVDEVMWVYELEIREIWRVPYTSAEGFWLVEYDSRQFVSRCSRSSASNIIIWAATIANWCSRINWQ